MISTSNLSWFNITLYRRRVTSTANFPFRLHTLLRPSIIIFCSFANLINMEGDNCSLWTKRKAMIFRVSWSYYVVERKTCFLLLGAVGSSAFGGFSLFGFGCWIFYFLMGYGYVSWSSFRVGILLSLSFSSSIFTSL